MRAVALLALAGCASAPSLSDVNDFAYWLQKIDLDALRRSRFDLAVIDPDGLSRDRIERSKRDMLLLAYLSIGEAENYRAYWRREWKERPPEWLGPENPDWQGNYKVRFWHPEWQRIAFDALDRVIALGFDGAYFDVVDAYAFWKERARMVEFVRSLSRRAKERAPGFLIFVQNAEELLEDSAYLAAIDGIGREEVYYMHGRPNDGAETAETERRLDLALAAGRKVLVIEYLAERAAVDRVYAHAKAKGYVPYVTDVQLDRLRINAGHEPD